MGQSTKRGEGGRGERERRRTGQSAPGFGRPDKKSRWPGPVCACYSVIAPVAGLLLWNEPTRAASAQVSLALVCLQAANRPRAEPSGLVVVAIETRGGGLRRSGHRGDGRVSTKIS